jgi:hypothetical protein
MTEESKLKINVGAGQIDPFRDAKRAGVRHVPATFCGIEQLVAQGLGVLLFRIGSVHLVMCNKSSNSHIPQAENLSRSLL